MTYLKHCQQKEIASNSSSDDDDDNIDKIGLSSSLQSSQESEFNSLSDSLYPVRYNKVSGIRSMGAGPGKQERPRAPFWKAIDST